jgi:hypothetical protein
VYEEKFIEKNLGERKFMSTFYRKHSSTVILLVMLLAVPVIGNSKEVSIDFARTSSVSVVKAEIIDNSDQELVIAGQLNRPHRLPMAGHLHAFSYLTNGDLITESKHRILGLNSKRKGFMQVPFKISIEEALEETDRIFLEYHSPGHSEK